MSFRCNQCKKSQKAKVKPIKVITGRRKKTYKDEEGAVIGEGWEIVSENSICSKCDEKLKASTPAPAPVSQPVVERPAPAPTNPPRKFNRPNRFNGPRDGRDNRGSYNRGR